MLDRIKREKLMFEIFWLLLLFFIATFKFYLGIYGRNKHIDFMMMFYTAVVYLVPNIVNARFCVTLYSLKNEGRKCKSDQLRKNVKTGYNLLNIFFWMSFMGNLAIHSIVFLFFNQAIFNSSLVFILILISYVFTFFIGLLTKFLNYFDSGDVKSNVGVVSNPLNELSKHEE
ncbi:hypothetical protein [Carnobacterium maltaromaticum]|uniref:hypothetical protein n=1 Tax=Carnobacterium maltaromaticum TaxID=2751 RepID=UPI0039BDBAB8